MSEQTPMFSPEEIPETDKPGKKRKETSNCLGEMLRLLMDERGLKDADVVRHTGIAWATWHGWVTEDVQCQLADDNLKKAMQFFNVHLEYLVFGIGDGEPAFEKFNDEKAGKQ